MKNKYYLAKTDPKTYSIEDFKQDKITTWDGVRNPQALKYIKAMKIHDRVFIYHSMGQSAIVGLAEVKSKPFIDPKDKTGKSWAIELKLLKAFSKPITLKIIKSTKLFSTWRLVYQSRLSTMDVPPEFITWVKKSFPGII